MFFQVEGDQAEAMALDKIERQKGPKNTYIHNMRMFILTHYAHVSAYITHYVHVSVYLTLCVCARAYICIL